VLPWVAILSGLLLLAGLWRRAAALWVSLLGVLLVLITYTAWKNGGALLVPVLSGQSTCFAALVVLLGGVWVLLAPDRSTP
jgi:hypothetical protein